MIVNHSYNFQNNILIKNVYYNDDIGKYMDLFITNLENENLTIVYSKYKSCIILWLIENQLEEFIESIQKYNDIIYGNGEIFFILLTQENLQF